MSAGLENTVLAGAFYAARLTPEWPTRPYWLLRRCVVPYVVVRQFLLLQRDGLPIAFAGWCLERDGESTPWRERSFLPSADEITRNGKDGRCVITEIISPFLPLAQVVAETGKYLGSARSPAWIERDAERNIIAIHPEGGT